jgi:hypothetical protein
MVVVTLLAVGLAFLVYRWAARAQPGTSGRPLNEIAALEV